MDRWKFFEYRTVFVVETITTSMTFPNVPNVCLVDKESIVLLGVISWIVADLETVIKTNWRGNTSSCVIKVLLEGYLIDRVGKKVGVLIIFRKIPTKCRQGSSLLSRRDTDSRLALSGVLMSSPDPRSGKSFCWRSLREKRQVVSKTGRRRNRRNGMSSGPLTLFPNNT